MLNTTNIAPPRVAMVDPKTGLVTREWYRFLDSLFKLTGDGQNTTSLQDLQIGPDGGTDTGLAVLETQIQDLAIAPANTPQITSSRYGTFIDTTTQTAAAINTAYGITLNTTELSNGVTVGTPTSRIYVDRLGVYNFQFSLQLNKSSAVGKHVYIWCRVNGVDVANSTGKVNLSGSDAAVVAAWNYVLEMNTGSYFELMWSTDDTGCRIIAAAAVAPAPGIPSVILTVTNNIKSEGPF